MTAWLERKEKMQRHENYIQWRTTGQLLAPYNSIPRYRIKMTQDPSAKVPIAVLETAYHAPFIRDNIARFIARFNHPEPEYSNRHIQKSDSVKANRTTINQPYTLLTGMSTSSRLSRRP